MYIVSEPPCESIIINGILQFNSLSCWGIFHAFFSSVDVFKINFSKNSFSSTTRVSNCLVPDQD